MRHEVADQGSEREERREPLGSARDGLEAMRLVLAAYESAKAGRTVDL
jgi:predicted dehydrogenase